MVDDDDGLISEKKFFEVPCPLGGGRAAEHHGSLHPSDYAKLTATRLNKKILHLRIQMFSPEVLAFVELKKLPNQTLSSFVVKSKGEVLECKQHNKIADTQLH